LRIGVRPFIERTTDTIAQLTGERGRTYGFVCIATDTAGNVDVKDPVLDALTFISTAGIPGDVNDDGKVDCADLNIVRSALGKRRGQVGYSAAADVTGDGIVDVRDLAFVSRRLPAGTRCP